MDRTLDEAMEELQENLDFSYFVDEIRGKQLTEEQHKAKERALVNLVLSQTPEHESRLQELYVQGRVQ